MCATVCDDTKCSKGQLLLFHNGYVLESAMTQNAARDSCCYSTTVMCARICDDTNRSKGQRLLFLYGYVYQS